MRITIEITDGEGTSSAAAIAQVPQALTTIIEAANAISGGPAPTEFNDAANGQSTLLPGPAIDVDSSDNAMDAPMSGGAAPSIGPGG